MNQKYYLSLALIFIFFLVTPYFLKAQCCAGGSGSPIAGGTSQGVMSDGQFEISTNFQYINSGKFYDKDKISSKKTFDGYSNLYEYFRLAYGVTKNFTISLESGYYFNKKETGLDNNPESTFESRGFGDIIIFPRYNILNSNTEKYHTELSVGLGFKLPLGSYNDSTGIVEPFSGDEYYVTKPTAVQLSSGSQDMIFYTFFLNQFKGTNLRLFANAFYIKKGYNPNGEKLGDYNSLGLFIGKSFFKDLSVTLQLRFENVGKMKINDNILLFGKPSNYFPEATGYKKIFLAPQLSYTIDKFTIFGSADIPVYQYLNTSPYYTQVGSQLQTSLGLAYRFFIL